MMMNPCLTVWTVDAALTDADICGPKTCSEPIVGFGKGGSHSRNPALRTWQLQPRGSEEGHLQEKKYKVPGYFITCRVCGAL